MVRLTARQQAILNYIRAHAPVSNSQVARHFGISTLTVGVHFQALRAAGLAHCSGLGCKSRWQITPPGGPQLRDGAPTPSVWSWAARHASLA